MQSCCVMEERSPRSPSKVIFRDLSFVWTTEETNENSSVTNNSFRESVFYWCGQINPFPSVDFWNTRRGPHYLTLNNNPSVDVSWTNPACLGRSSFPSQFPDHSLFFTAARSLKIAGKWETILFVSHIKAEEDARCGKSDRRVVIRRAFEVMNPLSLNFKSDQNCWLRLFPAASKAFYHHFSL